MYLGFGCRIMIEEPFSALPIDKIAGRLKKDIDEMMKQKQSRLKKRPCLALSPGCWPARACNACQTNSNLMLLKRAHAHALCCLSRILPYGSTPGLHTRKGPIRPTILHVAIWKVHRALACTESHPFAYAQCIQSTNIKHTLNCVALGEVQSNYRIENRLSDHSICSRLEMELHTSNTMHHCTLPLLADILRIACHAGH